MAVPLLLVAAGAGASPAGADPVSFEHGTIDHRFTTTQPGAPSGFNFDARYHAAGNPDAHPPYMRRMAFYSAEGLRYDTSVPDRCTASDVELALRGAAACPSGSRLGGGTTETAFMGGSTTTVELEFFNNTNEQIILARSPVLTTVARGKIHADGSVEFASPTCYPSVPGATCPVDNVLQLASSMQVPPYTERAADGSLRSWLTTPPTCPKSRRWRASVRFWWADGSEDTVAVEYACTRRSKPRACRRAAGNRRERSGCRGRGRR